MCLLLKSTVNRISVVFRFFSTFSSFSSDSLLCMCGFDTSGRLEISCDHSCSPDFELVEVLCAYILHMCKPSWLATVFKFDFLVVVVEVSFFRKLVLNLSFCRRSLNIYE